LKLVEEPDVGLAALLREVRLIEVQSRHLASGVMAGSYTSVFRGSGVEFEDVREYVEGDDPRTVDWNVTARVGRPYVKKYIDERDRTILFLLDLSASMTAGFGGWSARQVAVRVCACLALSAIQHDDKIGLIAFSRGVDRFVPPAKGLPHALRIVRDCLALRPAAAQTAVAPAIELAARVMRRRAVLFLVSDFLTPGWQDALALCSRRHDVIAVRILSPEIAAPRAGLMRLRDPESGLETVVDWGSARVRAAYAARVARWHDDVAGGLRRLGVDLMDVAVPRVPQQSAIARPILRLFRMRELRGAKR
jgi:uncharacterized protein (DUF58 family)